MANWIILTTCICFILLMKECRMSQVALRDISSNSSDNPEVEKTLQLLDEGEKVIQLSQLHRNATLLLGNTGSGKSTFVHWIAGDDNHLISNELEADTGEFLIESDNRIGSSIWSQTIFPELVVDNTTNAGFYDSPGFSDTRSTSHDIAATYFIKKVTDHLSDVKIVLIVNYPSVRQGVDRQDFVLLLRHFTDLVKNIEKYWASIAIVVTKVDNSYLKSSLIPDEKVINSIAKYFETVKTALLDKSQLSDISNEERDFCKNAIKLLNILLIRNNHNDYTRIGIFRRPDEAGPLAKMELLKVGKKRVQKMLYQELEFTEKSSDDFGFTISDKSKNDVNTLVDRINDKIWIDVAEIVDQVQNRYGNLFDAMYRKVNSFLENTGLVEAEEKYAHEFENAIRIAEQKISGLTAQSEGPFKMKDISSAIQTSIVDNLGFSACSDNAENIKIQSGYFEFLQTVSSKELKTRPLSVLFQQLETYLTVKKEQFYKDAHAISSQIYVKNEKNMENIDNAIEEYYRKKIDTTEIEKMSVELYQGSQIVSNWVNETCMGGGNWKELPEKIQKSKLAIASPMILIDAFSFSKNGNFFMFLNVFNNSKFDICNSTWILPLKKAETHLADLHQFVLFLHDLYDKLLEFEIQGSKNKYNVADLNEWGKGGQVHGIHIDKNNVEAFLGKISELNLKGYATTKKLSFTEFHLRLLNLVLEKTLKSQVHQTCLEPEKLILRGDLIKVSDFVTPRGYILQNCNYVITQVDVFALKTIFFDQDIRHNGLHLRIVAPNWQVIGTREINLDGAAGLPHKQLRADDGGIYDVDSSDGLAGLPGKHAGNFLGIGLKFINGRNLMISAVGGAGGPGQNGGNGMIGRDGSPARLGFSPMEYKNEKKMIALVYNTFNTIYKIHGEHGQRGGNGGHGGIAGFGGGGGLYNLVPLDRNYSTLPRTRNEDGHENFHGRFGYGARGGKNGDDLLATRCYKYVLFIPAGDSWCEQSRIRTSSRAERGVNGVSGISFRGGRHQPEQSEELQSISDTVRSYRNYLRDNLRDNFKTTALLEFCSRLQSNEGIRHITKSFFANSTDMIC